MVKGGGGGYTSGERSPGGSPMTWTFTLFYGLGSPCLLGKRAIWGHLLPNIAHSGAFFFHIFS